MGTHLWKCFKGLRTMNVLHQCHRQHHHPRNNTLATTVDRLCSGENELQISQSKSQIEQHSQLDCFIFILLWYRDTSSPITPLKSLDSPLLYGYKSANNSESSNSNSSGNSPNNTSNTENLNLIDLIVSTEHWDTANSLLVLNRSILLTELFCGQQYQWTYAFQK